MKIIQKLGIATAAAVVITTMIFAAIPPASAEIFFGGKIAATIDCDSVRCGGALRAIIVGPPYHGIFMETRSTHWYEYGSGDDGEWTVGQADGGTTCQIYVPMIGCIVILAGPVIDFAGTSKRF